MLKEPISCALLTPPGRGAIAVVAVFGESLAEKIDPFFESATGKTLLNASPQTFLYGRWRSTGEDVIISKLNNRLEIHCHGGTAAPAAILQNLQFAGFRPLNKEEAAIKLFGDNWIAEIASCLSQAPTERTAEILLNQLQLAPKALAQLDANCKSNDPEIRKLVQVSIDRMIATADFGIHLTQPWTVVLCGLPNVGKSSLINALVGFERAIVHSEAGTTRDVVTQLSAAEGWPIELKDTAGLREAKSEIERQGVQLSLAEIEAADLVIAVFDSTGIDAAHFDWDFVRKNRVGIVVLNKFDLLSQLESERLASDLWTELKLNDLSQVDVILVSATQLQGIEALVSAIARKIVPELPPSDMLIPVSARHVELLHSKLSNSL